MADITFGVSDFVALVNQTFEYAYPNVTIVGELANFKVSKNKWVYFDLKDDYASVRFFGTVYALPGPVEDGMVLEVQGNPRLHPQFGFSVTVQAMQPVGEGSIKRAANLLEAKLRAEGLFDDERKRPLPYPPTRIGLITSKESAAYADFTKILQARWQGVTVELIDVQVQGAAAVEQIVIAIEAFNQLDVPPEVLVLIRGGGSADDLQAFSSEPVTRAVAASRIPTCVAIGHEVDISLAELAADRRASTPSNAAELLVPDRREVLHRLAELRQSWAGYMDKRFVSERQSANAMREQFHQTMQTVLQTTRMHHERRKQLLAALNPEAALRRGYAMVRKSKSGQAISRAGLLADGDIVDITFQDATIRAEIKETGR